MSWLERAVERSTAVQRSRLRVAHQIATDTRRGSITGQGQGDDFTTQELVAEAGVALQTFYRYFSSKDELLLAVVGDAMTDLCVQMEQAAVELPDPMARLRHYVTCGREVGSDQSC